MKDEGHRTIDRAYDYAERMVDGIGAALGVDTNAKAIEGSKVKALKDANLAKTLPAGQAQRALPATREPFRIDQRFDRRGTSFWVVTNGIESAECGSFEFARQVLAAVESKT